MGGGRSQAFGGRVRQVDARTRDHQGLNQQTLSQQTLSQQTGD